MLAPDASEFTLRLATLADTPALRALITASVRGLSVGFYSAAQIESTLTHLLGPDTQLIADGTYYLVHEHTANLLVGAGGWSGRRTLYGGDQTKPGVDPLLDQTTEPARIRAFFVHPDRARRGIGQLLFERCRHDALAAGFRSFTLVATLPGEPFYAALGFAADRRDAVALPDGLSLPIVQMSRPI